MTVAKNSMKLKTMCEQNKQALNVNVRGTEVFIVTNVFMFYHFIKIIFVADV